MIMTPDAPLLTTAGIVKKYGDVTVLKDVDFSMKRGEVHSLVGENGAGKSTLVKIITGVTPRTAGDYVFDGNPVPVAHDRANAERIGISVIYQELSLVNALTVAQNIFLGREPTSLGFLMDVNGIYRKAEELIDRYGFPLHPNSKVDALSVGKRQLVEILKALSQEAKLLIMDEPTSALNAKESEILFGIVNKLRDQGVSVLYISHRMDEVYALSDRVTVLRDGGNIGILERGDIEPKKIISMMIGKVVGDRRELQIMKKTEGETILKTERLGGFDKFHSVSIELKKGEILGIGGLVGSGRTEFLRAVFGIDRVKKGTIAFQGREYQPTVAKSIRSGIGLIPEDRRQQGIVATLPILRNIALPNLDMLSTASVVSDSAESRLTDTVMDQVIIKPRNPKLDVGNLSGGNQQKVVVGKWLVRDLKLLLVDEPTVGIDVGAKDEIYNILFGLRDRGVGIILVSSDLPELVKVADRIIVLRDGRIFKEFDSGPVTEEDVLQASQGLI